MPRNAEFEFGSNQLVFGSERTVSVTLMSEAVEW